MVCRITAWVETWLNRPARNPMSEVTGVFRCRHTPQVAVVEVVDERAETPKVELCEAKVVMILVGRTEIGSFKHDSSAENVLICENCLG
jgi:hypothetical protein